jgi:glycosyltransferase involved in cell wall biosynthesis
MDIYRIKYAAAVKKALPVLVRENGIEAVCFTECFFEAAFWKPPKGCLTLMLADLGLSNERVNRRIRNLENRAVRNAHALYTPTAAMRRLAAEYFRIDKSDIEVIPNPMDTAAFRPASKTPESPGIVFVGRFTVEKGADVLIEVMPDLMKEFPDLRFTMVGQSGTDGNGVPFVRLLKERLKGNSVSNRFEWIKNAGRSELPGILQRHTIMVHPSLFDNFSLGVAEAQACGLAIVVADTGGSSEVIENGKTGVLVPAKDPAATREAI